MSVTLTLGWWLVPAGVTVLAFGLYAAWERRQPPVTGPYDVGQALGSMIFALAAGCASSLAWIVYLAIRLILA